MIEMKKRMYIWCIMLAAYSLAPGKELTIDTTVDNIGNSQLLERDALNGLGSPKGEELINKAVITVNGTNIVNNINLSGIRGQDNIIRNNNEINVISSDGGMGIVDKGSTIFNNGKINITGNKTFAILGEGSTIENNGDIVIETGTRGATGIKTVKGEITNNGEIVVKGRSSTAMIIGSGKQENSKLGNIHLLGSSSIGMEGEAGSVSINNGNIKGENVQNKGMISYAGADLKNSGSIEMKGLRSYGMSIDNRSAKSGNLFNEGVISINGDTSVGLIGININEIKNDGTISIEGYDGTGILYSKVDSLKNDGEIILKGNSNWAFSVDKVKDREVMSVGKISILDSRDSGAFKIEMNIDRGINYGNVEVTNGENIKVLNVVNNGEAINEGTINILSGKSNYGIYSPKGIKSINKGSVSLGGVGGVAIYSPRADFIQNTGRMVLNGLNQVGVYSENEGVGLVNTGKIILKGNGNIAFDVDENSNKIVKTVGNVLIDETAKGGIAAYARNTIKTAENDGIIEVKGKASSGLVGLDRTKLINNGIIKVNTEDSYGIQAVNDAEVRNNGSISNTAIDGVAIYMGLEDSNLYMDSSSSVEGMVVSAGGTGTFYGTNLKSNTSVHEIDYDLKNFSHLDLKEGNFILKKNNTLIAPKKEELSFKTLDTKSYTGSFVIDKNAKLIMDVYINKNNDPKNRLTSTIRADKLSINGVLEYRPLDQLYIVNSDVNKILVPNIYTNDEISGATDENIKITNVIGGWEGGYELSSDKTDLSLVLKRREGGKYLPDAYRDGVFNYPQTSLNVKYLNQSVNLSDNFKMIEKIHNAEIPYYFNFSTPGENGSYSGGDKKGEFKYNNFGIDFKSGYKIKENLVLGLGVSQLNTTTDYKGNSEENLQTYIVNTSIGYQLEELKIGAYLISSINKHKVNRKITGTNFKVNGNYDSNGFKGGLGAEYQYRTSSSNVLTGYFDAGLIYNETSSYKESGEELYGMQLSKGKAVTPVLKFGIATKKRTNNLQSKLGSELNYYAGKTMNERKGHFLFRPDVEYDIQPVNMPKLTMDINFGQELDFTDRLSVYYSSSLEVGEKFWGYQER